MKRKLTILLAMLIIGFLFVAHSQTPKQSYQPSLPDIIQSSPEVQSMTRYGDYPVDLSSGLINISVPLWTVQSGALSIPVSIGFHASGRKLDDMDGILGLGWTLNGTGVVTRQIKGRPDEVTRKKNNNGTIIPYITWLNYTEGQTPTYNDFYEFMPPYFRTNGDDSDDLARKEAEYDIFTYYLPNGKSGKFILKDTNGLKTAMTIPYSAVKIELPVDICNKNFKSLKITDTDGTQYFFGHDIKYLNYTDYSPYITDNYTNTRYDFDYVHFLTPNSWHLYKILSANDKDSIIYEYESIPQVKYFLTEEIIVRDKPDFDISIFDYDADDHELSDFFLDDGLFCPAYQSFGTKSYESRYVTKRLKKIIFKEGYALLHLTTPNKFLNMLEIKDLHNDIVRSIDFSLSIKTNDILHTLDHIYIKDKENVTVQTYRFDYYDTPNNCNWQCGKDWWGYLNNNTEPYLIPRQNVFIDIYRNYWAFCNYGNRVIGDGSPNIRNSNETYMKAGMLKSITYPNGGKTVFEYEGNKYFNGAAKQCGGLRIKTVANKDNQKVQSCKTYVYGKSFRPNTGYILAGMGNSENLYSETHTTYYHDRYNHYSMKKAVDYQTRQFTDTYMIDTQDFSGNLVFYTNISEILTDSVTGKSITTSYEYSLPETHNEANIQEYNITLDNVTQTRNPMRFVNNKFCWKGGKLTGKLFYKTENNNTSLLQTTYYLYDEEPFIKESVTALQARKYVNFQNDDSYHSNEASWAFYGSDKTRNRYSDIFAYTNYELTSGVENLVAEYITEYTENGNTNSVREITYNDDFQQIRKEELFNSDINYEKTGTISTVEYTYPFDYTNAPYTDMVVRNIIIPVVQTKQTINDKTLLKKINFWQPYNDIFVPHTTLFQTGNNPIETRITYHNYDSYGNPLYITKDDAEKVIYLWSYKGQYPIAEIKLKANIPFESAETAIRAVFNVASLDVLSAMTTPNETNLKNGYLQNALSSLGLVSTYTYKPLVGILTATDPRGTVTYYVYDAFGRLTETYYYENNDTSKKRTVGQQEYHYK